MTQYQRTFQLMTVGTAVVCILIIAVFKFL
jgi:hypothetical protein